MECKLPFCACKHILPHPRVFCVKTALKGREFRGKCGEMQGGAGSSGNYSLRRAAEDKPRTARHLPEEEAKLRNLANQENACSPLNPTPKKYCVFFWDPEGS